MGERNTDKTREQGVEFGTLARLIDDHSYPATSTTLIDEYGEQEVVLPDGTQTLADLFEPLQGEVFDSV